MPLNEIDAREQTILDREARIAESKKDRRARTIVAAISAAVAIATAYIAAMQVIRTLAAQRGRYEVKDTKWDSNDFLIKHDTVSGAAWYASRTEKRLVWKAIGDDGEEKGPNNTPEPMPAIVTPPAQEPRRP